MLSTVGKRRILGALIPSSILIGVVYFGDRRYDLVSMVIALAVCGRFMLSFEQKQHTTRRIVLLAILVGLCVVGRFLFIAVPGFKPVTAIVVLSGLYFGSEAGLVTGAMAALVSNLLFGQGPWTPFQMIAWGSIGYVSGIPALNKMLSTKLGLAIFGILSGIQYSLIMDIWSTVSMDGTFVFTRFITKIGTSLPFMIVYAVSNVIFLLIMRVPMGQKLERVKKIYKI